MPGVGGEWTLRGEVTLSSKMGTQNNKDVNKVHYFPPEVRRGQYLGMGVFLLQYSSLVKV